MVRVAVGVIVSDEMVYVTYRNKNQHQGEKWEFPGGKVEKDESAVDALKRELFEEVGINVINQSELTTIDFDYGDKQVKLEVYIVDQFQNEPQPKESQIGKWLNIKDLDPALFPKANIKIIEILQSSPKSN
ncbi:MAG: 8-oxo-dGTP diphosphatase MutT [Saccharospirillaceae bacterium]|nr:8-oxo-dGTP diphosphatase MutT [Pseudomonadales bacterium]NRB78205.1 8-oxo-dGTP diphosphatase MutT [Saccharospirillaceae bacterium]